MSRIRPFAWLLCLVLLCGCTAQPSAQPEDTVPAVEAETQATGDRNETEPEATSQEEMEAPAEQPDGDTAATEAVPPAGPQMEGEPAGSHEAGNQEPVAPAEEPDPTSEEPDAEKPAAAEPPVPPDSAVPGPWETENGLYYVQEDGTCLVDGTVGYLTFGSDGLYTSGDADLDAGVDALIAKVCPDLTADTESRLRLLYNFIRDNFRYLSMDHYEAGSTYWENSAALTMMNQGQGNCYNFTALFTACARRLGYQAYNVAGHEYSPDNDHAWTMIEWPDGVTYLFDVQLEYAYRYMYSGKPAIDMFKASGSNGYYNSFAYYFP